MPLVHFLGIYCQKHLLLSHSQLDPERAGGRGLLEYHLGLADIVKRERPLAQSNRILSKLQHTLIPYIVALARRHLHLVPLPHHLSLVPQLYTRKQDFLLLFWWIQVQRDKPEPRILLLEGTPWRCFHFDRNLLGPRMHGYIIVGGRTASKLHLSVPQRLLPAGHSLQLVFLPLRPEQTFLRERRPPRRVGLISLNHKVLLNGDHIPLWFFSLRRGGISEGLPPRILSLLLARLALGEILRALPPELIVSGGRRRDELSAKQTAVL